MTEPKIPSALASRNGSSANSTLDPAPSGSAAPDAGLPEPGVPDTLTVARDVRGAVACVLIFLVGALILSASRAYTPLGAVFPRTIAVVMMALAALYVVQVVRRPRPVSHETGGSHRRRFSMFVILLLWALSLEWLGFLTTSLIAYALALMVANFHPWSRRDALVYFGSGALVVAALYALFKSVLNVPLPTGWLL